MKPLLSVILFLLPFCAAVAQQKKAADVAYPQDYFRNPLDIPIFLAGNFGECRPGHFHSGTDIKTLGKENQPVHAAADGYISRIKMEKGGFGHGLYITHPNGYTTLYAHLNDFAPAIQKYVREQQYAKKRWDVDLTFTQSQFPVKKGQQIAWSGNTGASTAPHLHFEIRDTKTEHPLNPELFGLPVADHIAPVPAAVAIYNLSHSIYEQSPVMVSLKKSENGYTLLKAANKNYPVINDTISTDAFGNIGFGIDADDFMEGSDNTLAFLTAKLYMDDTLQTEVKLDDIGYDVTRYINAYADYKTHEQTGKWVQCLFKLPGNRLDNIYRYLNTQNGAITTNDWKAHKVRIALGDDRNNNTDITFYLKRGNNIVLPWSEAVFNTRFKAGEPGKFSNDNVQFSFDQKTLYDNMDFVYNDTAAPDMFSDKLMLHYSYVPVHHSFTLSIKASKDVPADLSSKVVLRYSDGKSSDGQSALATADGWYKASVRNFGTYWLDVDTIAPVIKSLQKNGSNLSKAKQITFEAKDGMTSVKSFSGYIDGSWVCFEQHSNLFFYKFDAHCPKGKHELTFKAEDENGNTATYHLTFTR